MATVLRIDPNTLPRVLILDPPISDEEFEALCRENRDVRMERSKEATAKLLFRGLKRLRELLEESNP